MKDNINAFTPKLIMLLIVLLPLSLFQGCDKCDGPDCEAVPAIRYFIANRSARPVEMVFYLDSQLVATGQESVELAPNTTVLLFDLVSYQGGGELTFLPAEMNGQAGTYDSLAIEFANDRMVLGYGLDCLQANNALCIDNYEKVEAENSISYTLQLIE